jgi:hypothetical protein
MPRARPLLANAFTTLTFSIELVAWFPGRLGAFTFGLTQIFSRLPISLIPTSMLRPSKRYPAWWQVAVNQDAFSWLDSP